MKKATLIGIVWCQAMLGVGQAPGSPDPSFGSGGVIQIDLADYDHCARVITDQSGYTYVFGSAGDYNGSFDFDMLILRLDGAGGYDNSFGQGGVVRMDPPGYSSSVITDALITDSCFYVITSGYDVSYPDTQKVLIGKFFHDGSIDPGYGVNGWYTHPLIGTYSSPGKIQMDDRGRLVFTALSLDTTYNHMETPIIGRLLPGGVPDSSFGGTGIVSWSVVNGTGSLDVKPTVQNRHADGSSLIDLTITDHGYLLGGFYYINVNHMCFAAMFDTTGQLNSSFGMGGLLTFDLNPGLSNKVLDIEEKDGLFWMLVQVDRDLSDDDFEVQVVDSTGLLLNRYSFDNNSNVDIPKDIMVDVNGNVIVVGYSVLPQNEGGGYTSDAFTVMRLSGTTLDPSFGSSGIVASTSANGYETGAQSVCLSPNQTITVGGFEKGTGGNYRDIVIRRYFNTDVTSISELDDRSFDIYPNPSTGIVHLPFETGTVDVYANDGRHVGRESVQGGSVDLEGLGPGVFRIILHSEDSSEYTVRYSTVVVTSK